MKRERSAPRRASEVVRMKRERSAPRPASEVVWMKRERSAPWPASEVDIVSGLECDFKAVDDAVKCSKVRKGEVATLREVLEKRFERLTASLEDIYSKLKAIKKRKQGRPFFPVFGLLLHLHGYHSLVAATLNRAGCPADLMEEMTMLNSQRLAEVQAKVS
eukprot:gene27792-34326_t